MSNLGVLSLSLSLMKILEFPVGQSNKQYRIIFRKTVLPRYLMVSFMLVDESITTGVTLFSGNSSANDN